MSLTELSLSEAMESPSNNIWQRSGRTLSVCPWRNRLPRDGPLKEVVDVVMGREAPTPFLSRMPDSEEGC
jgi:hypothetical protein